jgi:hypothetical protein
MDRARGDSPKEFVDAGDLGVLRFRPRRGIGAIDR